MKCISLLLLFSASSLFAMELTDEALQEFTCNKQRMIAVSQGKVTNPETNSFWKKYNALGQLNGPEARTQFEQLKMKDVFRDFFQFVIGHTEYKAALQSAKESMNDETWTAFRTKSASISKELLVKNNINCDRTGEYPTANHFNQNAQLNENQIHLIMASSYLLYYNRELQRKETGKPLQEIEITK